MLDLQKEEGMTPSHSSNHFNTWYIIRNMYNNVFNRPTGKHHFIGSQHQLLSLGTLKF